MNTDKQIARLKTRTTNQLQAEYARIRGRTTASRNRRYLVRQIAWGLEEAAWAEAEADGAVRPTVTVEVPCRLPSGHCEHVDGVALPPQKRDPRLPKPGTTLTRCYKGATVAVDVTDNGFIWMGDQYRTLSAVAKAITGTHVNGFRWFGLTEKK